MRLLVLYGSQTGTAQDVAEQIWRESRHWGFQGPVLSFEDYDMQQLVDERLVVFVAATTGDGVEPDNMKKAWRFLLKRSLPPNSLLGMQFACLGLGDSSYPKFNYAAKKLNKRLLNLGAKSVCPLGLCDDQHDYGHLSMFMSWVELLWSSLKANLGLAERKSNEDSESVNKFLVKEVLRHLQIKPEVETLFWTQKQQPHIFKLKENVRTTAETHFQDVRLLKLQCEAEELSWQPGDILELQPHNSPDTVKVFFNLLMEHDVDFDAGTVVSIKSAHLQMPLPKAYEVPLSLRHAAQYVWDLTAKPRQRFFEVLAQNCTDEMEREKLLEFCTAQGLDDLIAYVNRPRRSILEVLQDFRHATAKLTLPQLVEMMPIIQPRSFSIASADSSSTLDLLVAVVRYKTIMQTPRLGLCSNWLSQLTVGSDLRGVIKPGTMTLPQELNVPLIMVGPGTGIAPFRSIIQSRLQAKKQGSPVGPLIVFFGCRYKSADFHFEQDFKSWTDSNLVEAYFAFSRDGNEKVYVQNLIKNSSSRLAELIRKQNAYIYVAGNSNNMPKAVKEAFIEALDGDVNYLEMMIKQRRYQEETWA